MDLEAQVVDSPNSWAATNARQYVDSDGQDVDHPHKELMVLVYFRGRSTGRLRRVPVLSMREGDDWLIVASKGGADDHPQWYVNIAANPEVWVRDGADTHAATAVTLEGEERAAVWPALKQVMPMMSGYETKTDRVMPVVRLVRNV